MTSIWSPNKGVGEVWGASLMGDCGMGAGVSAGNATIRFGRPDKVD